MIKVKPNNLLENYEFSFSAYLFLNDKIELMQRFLLPNKE